MIYNKIKQIISNKNKKQDIKLNKYHYKNNNNIFKNENDYFLLDYSDNYSSYDY